MDIDKDEWLWYESRCRRCNTIRLWLFAKRNDYTEKGWPAIKEDLIKNPFQGKCEICNMYTVLHDIVSICN
ncbi:hypothetical protein [Adhaeribacter arboris]|uniref:hypothetical protein n=1 Tax=Adhaeribacter arboris TaxID=2072846 RepID=UPI0011B27C46|nr:hypothetical protein [Adhaeribacter arboris]